MKYRKLGSSDLDVSEICLGTMTWGEQNSENDAHQQLDYAASRGINFIDVAEMYPVPPKAQTQGRTEVYLGTWLKKQRRDKWIVATKIAAQGRGFAWVRGGPGPIGRKTIQEALDGSLKRLKPTTSIFAKFTGRTVICLCSATRFMTRSKNGQQLPLEGNSCAKTSKQRGLPYRTPFSRKSMPFTSVTPGTAI